MKLAVGCTGRRDHGGVIFLDVRDRAGIVQVVCNPDTPEAFALAEQIRSEYVIQVNGLVQNRPEGTVNPDMTTGEIEIVVQTLTILNKAKTPPFPLDGHQTVNEDVRLKYRYIDLRRPEMQKNLITRSLVSSYFRDYLNNAGFLEVETPMLTKATPEGARDYLVPSRTHQGEFFCATTITTTV